MNQQIALSEIRGVRVRCGTCAVVVTYPMEELKNAGTGCFHCVITRGAQAGNRTTATDRLRQLGSILKLLVDDEAAEVSLEVAPHEF